ncbi:MAG: hypothetical protein NTX50_26155 [Candidatus Sumerlaeota bacterium]|nr:hypothetical protein [Candidatus Sumerlaeota bacterium]
MRTRILKDLRMLLPLALLAAAGIAILVPLTDPVSFIITITMDPRSVGLLCFVILALAGAMAGVLLFTHEFNHQRMNWLLSQPASRTCLWIEKCLTLVTFLIGMLLLTLTLGAASEAVKAHLSPEKPRIAVYADVLTPDAGIIATSMGQYLAVMKSRNGLIPGAVFAYITAWMSDVWSEPILLYKDKDCLLTYSAYSVFRQQCANRLPFLICLAALAFGGLWMGLCLKQTPTAFAATLVVTFLGIALVQVPLWYMYPNLVAQSDALVWCGPSLFWCLCTLVGSFVQFKRLEV